jgi:hypothetical protein
MPVKTNNIVQVTNPDSQWFPCLVIVTEVKSWGIQGFTHIPMKGPAYIRLSRADFEVCVLGNAIIVPE